MPAAAARPRAFAPSPEPEPVPAGLGPLFWRRIPEVLATEPGIGPTELWVFFQFLCSIGVRDFSGEISQRDLAEKCRCADRTVRRALDKLARLGYLTVERERIGAVNTIRLGFEFRAVLVLQPEAPTTSGAGGRKRRQRILVSAIQPGEQRTPGSSGQRTPGSSAPYSLLDGLEKETTTTLGNPAPEERPDADRSSSPLSPSVQAVEAEAATEAPGSPQNDRREEKDESPRPAASRPLWAAQAAEKIAAAWPDAPAERREQWLRRLARRWRGARDENGRPASHGECGRVAALALEYAALKRAALKTQEDPVGYLLPVIDAWASGGLDSAGVELEVAVHRPRPVPATAAVEPSRPARREEPPEDVRAARTECLRSIRSGDAARIEAAQERLREAEEAWAARERSRLEGVSACPPAGPE